MSDKDEGWRACAHHDTVEAVLVRLEAFGDEFERLATTEDQRKLAAQFSSFVATLEPERVAELARPALDRLMDREGPELE